MTANVEFKYDVSLDNTMMQMAGELYGLKPLNNSVIIPELNGNVLHLHIKRLPPNFFQGGESARSSKTDRETAFDHLSDILTTGVIWAKLVDDEDNEVKMIIDTDDPDEIKRVGSSDELMVNIPVSVK